jgi:limonene-1,2-epoxide hydrolase
MKKLFTGIAQGIELKSDFHETQQKAEADKIAQGIVDSTTTDSTGVSAISGGEAGDTLVKPEAPADPAANTDIQRIGTTGKKITQAYSEGRISASQYWSQMDAMVKQARARYPAYADKIEAQVTSALGHRPAAAAIEAKRKEWTSTLAEKNEDEKKFNTFVDTNNEFLPPDYYQRQNAGQAYTKIETRAYVQERAQEKLAVELKRNRLALAKDQGNLTEEQSVGTALDEVTGFTNRIILDTADTSKNFTLLMDKARKDPKSFTPDEQMALRQQFSELKFKVQQGVQGILEKPWADGQTTYYNAIKSPEKIKHIQETALNRINYYEKLLNDKEYGVLNADIVRTKALKDEANRKVIESSDQIRIMQAVKDQGGQELLDEMLLSPQGQKMKSVAAQQLRNISLAKGMSGDSSSLKKDMDDNKHTNVDKPTRSKLQYQQIKDRVDVITNPRASPQIVLNTAKSLFGPENSDFLSGIKPEQKTGIYTRLASPEVTKTMVKMKATDPQAWNQYKQWTLDSFGGLFRQMANTIQEGVTMRPNIKIDYDKDANRFNVTSGSERKSDWRNPLAGALRSVENKFTDNVDATVQEFNRQIAVLAPILKADGQDISKELLGLFNGMGINTMAPKEASFWTKMREGAIRNFEKDNPPSGGEGEGKKR